MHRLVLALGVATLVSAAPAFAAEVTAAVKEINNVTRVVTLEDGKAYVAIRGSIDLTKIKVGDRVKVTYEPVNPIFASSFPGLTGSATSIAAAN
jgi:hypothetical protein